MPLAVKPVPAQEVVFVDDQVRIALPPLLIGPLLVSEAVGRFETVTVALAAPDPLPLVQVSVKVVFEVMFGIISVCGPAVISFDPDHPPDAVQEVGEFVDDQVRVDEPPLATEVGFAESVTTGGVVEVPAHTIGSLPATPYEDKSVAIPLALIQPIASEPHA